MGNNNNSSVSKVTLPVDFEPETEYPLLCCVNETKKFLVDPSKTEEEKKREEHTNLYPGDVFLGKITPEGIVIKPQYAKSDKYYLIPHQKVENNKKIKPQFLKINHPNLSNGNTSVKNRKQKTLKLFQKLTPLDSDLIQVILSYLSDEILLLQITTTLARDGDNYTHFTKPWIEDESTAKLYLKLLTLQNIYPFRKDMKNKTKFNEKDLPKYAPYSFRHTDLTTFYDITNVPESLKQVMQQLYTFNDQITQNNCKKLKYKMDLYVLPNDCSYNKNNEKNNNKRRKRLRDLTKTIQFNVSKDKPFIREYLTDKTVLVATKIDSNLDNILERNEVGGSRWFEVIFDKNCIHSKALDQLKIDKSILQQKKCELMLGIGGSLGYGKSRHYLQLYFNSGSVGIDYLPIATLSVV